LRIAIGPKDLENNTIEIARRDTKTKEIISMDNVYQYVPQMLKTIHDSIYERAKNFRDSMITPVNSYEEFKEVLDTKGGFISAHWDGTGETEERIKAETKATIRCIPLNNPQEEGKCILTGKPSKERVLFARAY
jgi:prolyl-tRNA synthetase